MTDASLSKSPPISAKVQCATCDFECSSKQYMAIHTLSHVQQNQVSLEDVTQDEETRNYIKLWNAKLSKPLHIYNNTSKLICNVCQFECEDQDHLAMHMLGHAQQGDLEIGAFQNSSAEQRTCTFCGVNTGSKEAFTMHVLAHIHTFETSSLLSLKQPEPRLREATASNQIQCTKEARNAQNSEKRNGNTVCCLCGMILNSDSELSSHMSVHSKENLANVAIKPEKEWNTAVSGVNGIPCTECSMKFCSQDDLAMHMMSHVKDESKRQEPVKTSDTTYLDELRENKVWREYSLNRPKRGRPRGRRSTTSSSEQSESAMIALDTTWLSNLSKITKYNDKVFTENTEDLDAYSLTGTYVCQQSESQTTDKISKSATCPNANNIIGRSHSVPGYLMDNQIAKTTLERQCISTPGTSAIYWKELPASNMKGFLKRNPPGGENPYSSKTTGVNHMYCCACAEVVPQDSLNTHNRSVRHEIKMKQYIVLQQKILPEGELNMGIGIVDDGPSYHPSELSVQNSIHQKRKSLEEIMEQKKLKRKRDTDIATTLQTMIEKEIQASKNHEVSIPLNLSITESANHIKSGSVQSLANLSTSNTEITATSATLGNVLHSPSTDGQGKQPAVKSASPGSSTNILDSDVEAAPDIIKFLQENKDKLHMCKHCKIVFVQKTIFCLHMGLHNLNNPWQCNLCGKVCSDAQDFSSHVVHY